MLFATTLLTYLSLWLPNKATSYVFKEPYSDGVAQTLRPHPQAPGKRMPVQNLYQRRYSDISWIGTHNSEALRREDNGWSLSGTKIH